MKKLLALLLLVPSLVYANQAVNSVVGAAVVGGAIGGAVVGTQYSFYQALKMRELKGWADKETGTSTTLESQCDIQGEFHLVGSHRMNYVLLGLSNTSANSVTINYSEIEFVFNGVNSRYPGWVNQQSSVELKANWWTLNYVPFPSKEEFEDYDKLEIKIPLILANNKSCIVSAKFNKHKRVLQEEFSFSILDISFEGGFPITQTSPVKYLGKPNAIAGFNFNLFPHPNHGVGFNFLSEFGFKDSKNQKIQNEFAKGSRYEAISNIFGLNYVYRHFFSPKLSLNYEPAVGWQIIRDNNDKGENSEKTQKSSALALYHKLMLNWTFARIPTPTYETIDFTIGLGVTQIWIPNDEINGQNLNGSRYGALVRFGMGI